jgi:hypothetical protein
MSDAPEWWIQPETWYEVHLREDSCPPPKTCTREDAEALCWLLWEKHRGFYCVHEVDRVRRRIVFQLDETGHEYTERSKG